MPYKTTFNQLPAELLLCVCEYLSPSDIFFSFDGLNCRISRTIRDYFRHFFLAQLPFARFDHICRSVLPEIGPQLRSLTISNEWTAVLSKVFLSHFGAQLSSTFANLERLTLVAFINRSLSLLLDCLNDLDELRELRVSGLFVEFPNAQDSEVFLYRILSANNQRLNSVLFDHFSSSFHVNTANEDIQFANIERLRIELKNLDDLHRLLSLLPRLQFLHTRLHDESLDNDKNRPATAGTCFEIVSFTIHSPLVVILRVEVSAEPHAELGRPFDRHRFVLER